MIRRRRLINFRSENVQIYAASTDEKTNTLEYRDSRGAKDSTDPRFSQVDRFFALQVRVL